MRLKGPQKLGDLLSSDLLKNLAERGREHRELTAEVRGALPAEEALHVVMAELDARGRLLVTMDSSAWAARVRFRAEQLGERGLRVRVLPSGGADPS